MAKAKYKQGKDGLYRTKAWDGTFNPDGTKHRINLYSSKSSRDLENKVNALKEEIRTGQSRLPNEYLFQDYARHWLLAKKSVREKNTQTMYDNIVEVHFSFLADVRLSDIRHSHFEQAIANAVDKPRTCQLIYITFRQIMRMAVSDHFITKDDFEQICDDIALPKYKRQEKRPLSDVEKSALKDCFSSGVFTSRERAFLTLIYYCGLRKGDDDDKIRLNQRKPSKYKGLSRFGPEKNLQRINKFMKERPTFYKKLIQMKENFRFYLRCFYCITKVVILQFNSEKQDRISS